MKVLMIQTITVIMINVFYMIAATYVVNLHYLLFMVMSMIAIHYWGKEKYGCSIIDDYYTDDFDDPDNDDSTGKNVKII